MSICAPIRQLPDLWYVSINETSCISDACVLQMFSPYNLVYSYFICLLIMSEIVEDTSCQCIQNVSRVYTLLHLTSVSLILAKGGEDDEIKLLFKMSDKFS